MSVLRMRPQRLGRYELLRHLASGGMARVYLARATGPGGFARHVVVKTIPPERIDDDAFVALFLDEARLVATLHHQHIAQVFEVGRSDDGAYFLAMEYVHGETVRHLLQAATDRRVKLPLELGLSIASAAAAGLHHAHERRDIDGTPLGIVHRDVSPSNLILGFDGSIKLIDFGIAKATLRTTHTATGFIKGKAGYMAPEQARGYDVDRRSDVFSLGVLAYELTTQSRAFHADSQFETMRRTMYGEIEPPKKRVRGYPPALEDIVMTALELDPDDRFQDAEAMRVAFEQVARELGFQLGDAPVIRALEDLFPRRPEPWLASAALPVDESPANAGSEPMIMIAPRTPSKLRLARGTENPEAQAVPESTTGVETVDLTLDLTTRPFPRAAEAQPVQFAQPAAVSAVLPLPPRRATPTPIPVMVPAVDYTPVPVREAPLPARKSGLLPLPSMPTSLLSTRPRFRRTTARIDAASERRRRAETILVAAVGVLGVLTIIIVLARSSAHAPSPPEPSTAAAVPPTPAPAPPPPVATLQPARVDDGTVLLHVTTEPEGATVVLDGVRLGVTPFALRVPRKDGAWLKVRKRGFAAVKTRVSLDHDVDWDVAMRRLSR